MMTNPTESRRRFPWSPRVSFPVGKTRKQRQSQYRHQMNMLVFVLLASLLSGLVVVWINYQGAGTTKTVSCDTYPRYCVPFAGGSSSDVFAANETANSRTLDGDSVGAPGVVRGIADDTMPFIGDPAAPVEIAVISAFSCSHCQTYHEDELMMVIEDFALTGQAVVRDVLIPRYDADMLAMQAAMCAGEQGAYWEMTSELYRQASTESITTAFTTARLQQTAEDMGLDGDAVLNCLVSNRYAAPITANQEFARDNGVTGTPTVLIRRAGTSQWSPIMRDYNSLRAAIESAP